MKKRIISALLVLSMMLALLPTIVLAEGSAKPAEPMLTGLTVLDKNGKIVSLLDSNETTTVSLGEIYTFEVSFSNAEQIHEVYITSTKGNEKAFLETTFNENKHVFVSTGFFNDDSKYIPGKIGVEYTKKTNDVKVGSSVDWGALQSALNEQCTATVDSISDEAMQATVDISKLLNEETKVAVNVAIDVFNAKSDGNLNEWLGYYHDLEAMQKRVLEGGKYYLYLDDTSMETYIAMVVRDVSESRYTKIVLKEAGEYTKSLKEVAEDLGTINLISGIVYDFFDIQDNVKDLRQEISRSSFILESQKAGLYTKVDEYETDRRSFSLLTALLPVVVGATGGTMAGPAIVFTALLGAINAASSTFWDYRIGLIQGCEPIDANFVSDAHGIPLTDEYLRANKNKITASGTYYLTKNTYEDGLRRSFSIGDSDSGTSVDVTLCLHGYSCSAGLAGDGSTLKICDCTYREDENGTVVGGSANINGFYNNQTIFVENGRIGEIHMWAEDTGTVIVNGGVVTYINMNHADGNGQAIINGGTIGLGILAYGDESEIIINKGLVLAPVSSGQFSRAHIRTDSGNIKIYGGQICTSIEAGTGTLSIYDGNIVSSLKNDGGIANINGGIVKSIENKSGFIIVDGGEIKSIENQSDGIVHIHSDGIVGEQGSRKAAIVNTGGAVTIDGGRIIGDVTNNWGKVDSIGEITINGGTILGCVSNNNSYSGKANENIESTKLTINGGEFQNDGGYCIANRYGIVNISGGVFRGKYGIGNHDQSSTTLLINSNSRIEADCTESVYQNIGHALPTLSVQAGKGYDGNVIYYKTPNAQGVKMTIQEAANIDYTQPYVRLAADDATGGPSGGSITLPDGIKDALADGTAVFAASYRVSTPI